MLMRSSISSVTLIGVLCASLNGAWALDETWALDEIWALDETKYPNWKGQWVRADSAETAPRDARKPRGLGQQPPLTPEFQALFEANLKHLAAGVKASGPRARCIPAAVPRDEITTFDGALNEPRSVSQSYGHAARLRPVWTERRRI